MKILVTGSNGYIASNLIKRLIKNNHQVIGLSRNMGRIDDKYFEAINCDLSGPKFIHQIPDDIEIIYHLAQSSQYRQFPDGAIDMFDVNIRSTQLLADWAVKNDVKKFIYTSTGNVYKEADQAVDESFTCDPQSYYAASKYASELLLREYSSSFPVIIARLFTVYGPGQTDMLIPNVIERIKSNKQITLANDKGIFLSPLYIGDCCQFLTRLVELNSRGTNCFNLAGACIHDLGEIVHVVGEILEIEVNKQTIDKREKWLCSKIDVIEKATGFTPEVGIHEGLRKILE